jgi:hypothetical protein
MYSRDVVEELEKMLSEELARSIDKQIIQGLKPFIRDVKIDSILESIDRKDKKEN